MNVRNFENEEREIIQIIDNFIEDAEETSNNECFVLTEVSIIMEPLE